jgi:hypothetical protein
MADPPASARRSRYSIPAPSPATVTPSAAAWPTTPATGPAPGTARRIPAARPRANRPSAMAIPCRPALTAAPISSDLVTGGSGIGAGASSPPAAAPVSGSVAGPSRAGSAAARVW